MRPPPRPKLRPPSPRVAPNATGSQRAFEALRQRQQLEPRHDVTLAFNRALGVTCDHCHTADWKGYAKPPMKLVKTMNAMFEEFPKYMPATARTQCYMCHKGSTKPELNSKLQTPNSKRY